MWTMCSPSSPLSTFFKWLLTSGTRELTCCKWRDFSVCNMLIKKWKTQGLVQMKSLVLPIVYLYHILLSPFSTYSFDINCGRDSLTAMQKTCNKKVPLKAKSFKFLLIVPTTTEVIASTSWTENNVFFNVIKKIHQRNIQTID